MRTINFLRTITLAACLLSGLASQAHAASGQPNILWIITDDQRPDSVQAYNRATRGTSEGELGYVSSPNIDKLASEGVLFTRAYAAAPVCSASRSALITGVSQTTTGTHQQG